ncbi:THO complex subunit 1 transcription elongation factor family protein [Acanthocheilonema viteae]
MEKAIFALDFEQIKAAYKKMKEDGSAAEVIRLTIENAIHRKAFEIAQSAISEQENLLRQLLVVTFQAAKEDFCAKGTTVAVVQDVFDVSPVKRCEELFGVVEDNLPQWKMGIFYEPCKNMILRMCNDLLKRLSRTVDTSFCGRILVLLAHALPLCEKSGLNLVSHFNLDNITKYDLADSCLAVNSNLMEDNDVMEVGEISEREIPVDYTLYAKFWQLQSFFSSPATCFEKSKWRTFQQNTTEVLNIFSSHKLESSAALEGSKRERLKQENSNDEIAAIPSTSKTAGDEDIYFAKYLTSQKLLQLQLNDSQFRRYFLVQCLILYQYLVSDIKFKDKSFTLNDEQLRFIIESTERCFRLLRETHPEGSHFADAMKVILHREKEWSEWKNKGCLDYTQLADKEKPSVFKKRPRNRYDPSKLDLGNSELTKLWNINPDMLSACEDSKRNFIPKLVNFLEDPLDELNPEQMVEEQYRSITNESFQWRASRLLMSQSTSYFQIPSKRNEVTTNLAPFLEEVIRHTAANFPELKDRIPGFTDNKKSIKGTVNNANSCASSALHNGKEHIEPSAALTDSHIEQLAPLLANSWSTLADVMNINKERNDAKDEPMKVAQRILTAWRQKEGKGATVKRISSVLLMAELFSEQVGQVFRGNTPKRIST